MRTPLPFVALLLAGCPGQAGFPTDNGQLRVTAEGAVDLRAGPSAVLAGSTMCVEVQADQELPEGDFDPVACFEQSFAGPVEASVDCLAFTGPGTVDWTFTARPCPGNDFGYAPVDDHVAIPVVDPAAVTGSLPLRLEEAAESVEEEDGFVLDRPDDWTPAEGEPLRLVIDQPFQVQPRLLSDDGHLVAWWDAEATITGAATVEPAETRGTFEVELLAEGTSTLSLALVGTEIPVGEVVGVEASEASSIELAVLSIDDTASGGGSFPYGARAVVRDGDGNLIFGAPVEWHFAKLLPTSGVENNLPGADYVTFTDVCQDPGTTFGEQRGTLTASLGLLSASKELVWTPRPAAAAEQGWTADERCQTPTIGDLCGCATGGSAPAGFTVLGLVALLRRRRT